LLRKKGALTGFDVASDLEEGAQGIGEDGEDGDLGKRERISIVGARREEAKDKARYEQRRRPGSEQERGVR
jgi:hypothetical protein